MNPKGLEIVTVALDTGGSEACREYIEAANPEHPSLIDEAHVVDELLGIVNVPNGVWIDEQGVLVRPAEPAWTHSVDNSNFPIPEDASAERKERINLARRLIIDGDTYVNALRDWVGKGPDSVFALEPDEVIRRSHPRPLEVGAAAAHFEMGQHLHRAGHPTDAMFHFREAHRAQPNNWTYKRQAWSLVDAAEGLEDFYDGNYADDVKAIGPESYYPRFAP